KPGLTAEFAGVVDGWVAELKRQLNEWFEHNSAAAPQAAEFELIASGGGVEQTGLLDSLKARAGLELRPWPRPGTAGPASRTQGAAGHTATPAPRTTQPHMAFPAKGFEVVFGAALQALGHSPQPISLLPDDYRQAWRKRLGRQRIELASLVLAAVCALVLALGTWHKLSLYSAKSALWSKLRAGQH